MLELKIVSLDGCIEGIKCDSVHLMLCDDNNGEGGGSVGIRTGHIKSLMSIEKGKVTADLEGKEVFSCTTQGGFATVENDTVTVVTERMQN